jgi:hypothetical protein
VTYYNRPACAGCVNLIVWDLGSDRYDACGVIAEAHKTPDLLGLAQMVTTWVDVYQTGPIDPNPPLCPGRTESVDEVCDHGILLGDLCLSCRAESENDSRYDAYKEGD